MSAGPHWATMDGMSGTVFRQDTESERFVLRDEEGALLSAVDYRVNGPVIALTHVFTPPALRGRGWAAEAMRHTVDHIAQQGDLRVRPSCWYAARWFERHPERASLLVDASAAH